MNDDKTLQVRSYPFGDPAGLELDPLYAELRESEPLSRVQLPYGDEAWLATRYADIRKVMTDNTFSRAATLHRDEPRIGEEVVDRGLLSMDPPDHTRLRRVANAGLTPRQTERLRPLTERIADELLDALSRKESGESPADLMAEFINPLAVTVICELLGVPFEDRADFQEWSQAVVSTTSLPPAKMNEYMGNLHSYMAKLVAIRRSEPTDGLLNGMIQARDEDPERLTEDELVLVAVRLLAPGVQNTVLTLANFVLVLMQHPEEFDRLRTDPGLVPAAVEELIRYTPFHTSTMFPRYATEDVELGGTVVRAGEAVVGSICAANRDRDVFSSPEELDFERGPNPHLGFGLGAHFCPGAHLARMQLQVAIAALARRVEGLRLAVPEEELSWKQGMVVRWLDALPVTWSRISG
ncbi:cytochrome P450 [Streptomyces roseifaciens]|uniref:cytochrome P450 n=1 Tax=Streptomyces roseifaciens TaxID=1488406 RepID=UPI0007180C5C|nr:cytochrome P450 [Streptomyces roseifaciens]